MAKKPQESPPPGWLDAAKMSEMERKLKEDKFGFKDMTLEQLQELGRRLFG
jgi:hypothetical protein